MKAGTFKYQEDSKPHKPPPAIWYRGYAEYFEGATRHRVPCTAVRKSKALALKDAAKLIAKLEKKNRKLITLSGLGDFSENEEGPKDLKRAAKAHKVLFYPTYYDHELKGTAEAIEAITKELWGMKRDEWADNWLTETPV